MAEKTNDDSSASDSDENIMLTGTTLTTTLLRMYTFEGHTNTVWGCTFSPDGMLIATASEDNTLKLWDTETGKLVRTLGHRNEPLRLFSETEPQGRIMPDSVNALNEEGHIDCVWKGVFSLDSKNLVSCSKDGSMIMWDVATGKKVRTFIGHQGEICKSVSCCAFSPGATQLNGTVDVARGSVLVSSSWDGTLIQWNVETGETLGLLKGHSHYVYCCEFSFDGYFILSCSHDCTAKLWSTIDNVCIKTFNGISEDKNDIPGHTKMISWCCFRPGQPILNQQVITCSADMTLRLWSVKTRKVIRVFLGHSGPVQSCSASPDGKLLFSVSWDKSIKIWEIQNAECIKTLEQEKGIENGVDSIGIDKTLTQIITTGGHMAKLWQLKAERK